MTVLTSSGVVESHSVEVDSASVSYSTFHLSSLFASFLTGDYGNTMRLQKYFELYEGSPCDIKNAYEEEGNLATPLINKFPVRISSTSVDDANNYSATFIATIQGSDYSLRSFANTPQLTLGLIAGDYLLAVTTFDNTVYNKLLEGARVEIKWKLQLQDSTTSV